MSIVMTVTAVNAVGNQLRVVTSLSFSGSYPAGGDTLDLTSVEGQSHGVGVAVFNAPPIASDATLGGGFDMEIIPGATLATFKGKIFSSGGSELSAGTYAANAALLLASLNSAIEWVFDKLL